MLQFARIAGFLILTGASLAGLGFLSPELNRLLSLAGLAIFLGTLAPLVRGMPRISRGRWLAGAAIMLAGLPAAAVSSLGLVYLPLFALAGVALLLAGAPRVARLELHSYALALCLIVVAAELERLLPLLWHLKMALAALLSRVATTLAREPRNLGPTAMGLPPLFALAAVVLARASTTADRGRPPLWLSLPLILAAHLGYLLLLTPFAVWSMRRVPPWESLLLNSQGLFLLLGALVFALMNGFAAAHSVGAETPSEAGAVAEPGGRRSGLAWRAIMALVLGVALVMVFGRGMSIPPRPVKVLIYDAGFMNWNIPVHGIYGEKSGGMFGMLPGVLQSGGCVVEAGKDLARLEGPQRPDCLVMINIQKYLEPADRERILRFVRMGGGLLCLGDHTGVAGIRGPFNDLLGPLGIRFRFDSATFFSSGWSHAFEIRSHPVNRGVRNEDDYQIWVGASLDLNPAAAPVVVARYGFSDLGDVTQLTRSYLGDRVYNPDEQLGDLTLVGEARYGRGKVMVFGDTSPYQNLALPRSYDFVLRSIRYLGHPGGGPPPLALQLVSLLFTALAFGLLTRGMRELSPAAFVAAGLLAASLAVALGTRAPVEPPPDWSRAIGIPSRTPLPYPQRLAILDRSHGGRFDMRAWEDISVGGLVLNLMRDGFFPVVTDQFPSRMLGKAGLVVLIAPQRSYSQEERGLLHRYMERGGRILACVGNEECDGMKSFLDGYGFQVLDLPLAHFRTGESTNDLVFLEGWALRCPVGSHVLVSQWDQPVVASLPLRHGELVVVGDTQFLFNRNLESREIYFAGNIRFLESIATGRPIAPIEGKFRITGEEVGALADVPVHSRPAVAAPTAGERDRSLRRPDARGAPRGPR